MLNTTIIFYTKQSLLIIVSHIPHLLFQGGYPNRSGDELKFLFVTSHDDIWGRMVLELSDKWQVSGTLLR